MKKQLIYIGYEYEPLFGNEKIRKLVICESEEEYKTMKNRIKECGYQLIEFSQVFSAKPYLK